MKFQIVLAAIFAFVAVSSKKWGGYEQIQNVHANNRACADGNSLAINCAGWGDANAVACVEGQNANLVCQNQH